MPDKTGRLNPQEQVFAQIMARTSDGAYAAEKAGYASPAKRASQNMNKPAIAEAVRKEARDILTAGAVIGAQVLVDIARDASQPAGARVNAADKLLRHSGISAAGGADDKDLQDMSLAELQKRAAELRQLNDAVDRERADRAKPVLEHRPAVGGVGESGSVFG